MFQQPPIKTFPKKSKKETKKNLKNWQPTKRFNKLAASKNCEKLNIQTEI